MATNQFIGEIRVCALRIQQLDVPLQRGAPNLKLATLFLQMGAIAADIVKREPARRAEKCVRAKIQDNEQTKCRKQGALGQLEQREGLHGQQNHARTAPSSAAPHTAIRIGPPGVNIGRVRSG